MLRPSFAYMPFDPSSKDRHAPIRFSLAPSQESREKRGKISGPLRRKIHQPQQSERVLRSVQLPRRLTFLYRKPATKPRCTGTESCPAVPQEERSPGSIPNG